MVRIVIVSASTLAFTLIFKGKKSSDDRKRHEGKLFSWLDPTRGPGISHGCG